MKRVLYFLALLLLCNCHHTKNGEVIKAEENKPGPFIGMWQSVDRDYPYGASLMINKDSTFCFHYGTCLSHGFSEGRWKYNDSIIILKSVHTDSCMYLSHFGVDCLPVTDSTDLLYEIETTIEECEPLNTNDYVLFDYEEFCIQSDTLKHIVKGEKLCPNIKNHFLKVKKDTVINQ